jgi:hypothetical protein
VTVAIILVVVCAVVAFGYCCVTGGPAGMACAKCGCVFCVTLGDGMNSCFKSIIAACVRCSKECQRGHEMAKGGASSMSVGMASRMRETEYVGTNSSVRDHLGLVRKIFENEFEDYKDRSGYAQDQWRSRFSEYAKKALMKYPDRKDEMIVVLYPTQNTIDNLRSSLPSKKEFADWFFSTHVYVAKDKETEENEPVLNQLERWDANVSKSGNQQSARLTGKDEPFMFEFTRLEENGTRNVTLTVERKVTRINGSDVSVLKTLDDELGTNVGAQVIVPNSFMVKTVFVGYSSNEFLYSKEAEKVRQSGKKDQ